MNLYNLETEHPNEVVLREIYNNQVLIFKPDGSLLGATRNELTFNDFRIQVKEKELSGYSISVDGGETKIPVDKDGQLERWPDGLFTIQEQQLCVLIGF